MSHSIHSHPVLNDGIITLFHEHKLFWRERINVDIAIRLYLATSVIEINAYNLDDDVESPKLYIDKDKLFSRLDGGDVDAKVQETQQDLIRKRKPKLPMAELTESIRRKLVSEFICMRLNIVRDKKKVPRAAGKASAPITVCERCLRYEKCIRCSAEEKEARRAAVAERSITEEYVIDKSTFRVSFDPLEGEVPFEFFVVKPGNLETVTLARRRRTNAADFHNELSNFRADTESLSDASQTAARIAGLATQSVDGFKKTKKRVDFDPRIYSQSRIRWMKAIHRIILQNAVAAYTQMWERSIHNPDRVTDANVDDDYERRAADASTTRDSYASYGDGEVDGDVDFDELDYRASFSSNSSRRLCIDRRLLALSFSGFSDKSDEGQKTGTGRRHTSISFVSEEGNTSRRTSFRASIDSTNAEDESSLPQIGGGARRSATRSSFSRYARDGRESSTDKLPSITEVNRIDVLSTQNRLRRSMNLDS